jgi:hypothetical protein
MLLNATGSSADSVHTPVSESSDLQSPEPQALPMDL